MKKVYRLTGLCCANCAAKIERMVQKLDAVSTANLSFMSQKLMVEMQEDNSEKTIEDILAIIKKIEPDVVVTNA